MGGPAGTVREWFVADEVALGAAVRLAKLRACDHCRRVGRLIGHGRLVGYAEASSDRVVRGHRVLCSNRGRRDGCGHTVAVMLASIVPGRVVRAATVFALFAAVANGATTSEAWRRSSAMTLRTGYRVRRALALAGPAIRTALLSRGPPPNAASPSPDAQLLAHVRSALGADVASFDLFQLAFQRAVLP